MPQQALLLTDTIVLTCTHLQVQISLEGLRWRAVGSDLEMSTSYQTRGDLKSVMRGCHGLQAGNMIVPIAAILR